MELLKKDTIKPSDIRFLHEILDNIDMMETALMRSGEIYEVFVRNKEDIYIIKNAMQEIGELSKNISEPLKEKYGDSVDWDALKYTRDQLAHGYLSIIETKTLWRLANFRVKDTRRRIEQVISSVSTPNMTESEGLAVIEELLSKSGHADAARNVRVVLCDGMDTKDDKALELWRRPTFYKRSQGKKKPLAFHACRMGLVGPDFPYLFDIQHEGTFLIEDLIYRRTLPADFPYWDKRIGNTTVAHYALMNSNLPSNFFRWDICDAEGASLARKALEKGCLPPNFGKWGIMDNDGSNWTVAHEAAEQKLLPDDFFDWSLVDAEGTTVAQIAVESGTIPDYPQAWALRCPDGQTVAHKMAQRGLLPSDFDMYHLCDAQGRTVLDELRDAGCLPPEERRETEDPDAEEDLPSR